MEGDLDGFVFADGGFEGEHGGGEGHGVVLLFLFCGGVFFFGWEEGNRKMTVV